MSLNVGGDSQSGIVEQGGGEIDMIDHRIALPGFVFPEIDEQGLVHGVLIHPLLVVKTMLTQGNPWSDV